MLLTAVLVGMADSAESAPAATNPAQVARKKTKSATKTTNQASSSTYLKDGGECNKDFKRARRFFFSGNKKYIAAN